jgi:hypothetical protein
LEKLAEKQHFHVSSGNFVLHMKINAIETGNDYVQLLVLCTPQRFKLPAFVFFRLDGQMRRSEDGTLIQLELHVTRPFSQVEWDYLIVWLLILGLALVGGVVGVRSSNLLRGLLIGLAFLAAGLGYGWILYQTYRSGMVKIPVLVYEALRQDLPGTFPGYDAKPPDWASSLSESP